MKSQVWISLPSENLRNMMWRDSQSKNYNYLQQPSVRVDIKTRKLFCMIQLIQEKMIPIEWSAICKIIPWAEVNSLCYVSIFIMLHLKIFAPWTEYTTYQIPHVTNKHKHFRMQNVWILTCGIKNSRLPMDGTPYYWKN